MEKLEREGVRINSELDQNEAEIKGVVIEQWRQDPDALIGQFNDVMDGVMISGTTVAELVFMLGLVQMRRTLTDLLVSSGSIDENGDVQIDMEGVE